VDFWLTNKRVDTFNYTMVVTVRGALFWISSLMSLEICCIQKLIFIPSYFSFWYICSIVCSIWAGHWWSSGDQYNLLLWAFICWVYSKNFDLVWNVIQIIDLRSGLWGFALCFSGLVSSQLQSSV
jgi:hypothetical protein